MKQISDYDFICVTGDCYVDHPSFGIAIIVRLLESCGYSVAIIDAPDVKNRNCFTVYGQPKLGFFVTSGNIDSMVSNYTTALKKRSDDVYIVKGYPKRPDRALIRYCNMIRDSYPDSQIIIGGLEASLRRLSHYDYWDDRIMPSVLADSNADILVYGMGEHQTVQIAKSLANGDDLTSIMGTVVKSNTLHEGYKLLPSYRNVVSDKKQFVLSFKTQYDNNDYTNAVGLAEKYDGFYILQNPPAAPLTTPELDKTYALPFTRKPHDKYSGCKVDSLDEVEFSIIHNRGCFGACNFCSLAFHQGKYVTSRSKESVVNEAKSFVSDENFKGYISDVGGPTANFRSHNCKTCESNGFCKNKRCLSPTVCENLKIDHNEYLEILRELRDIEGIKKVFIRSGIRFDYLIEDKNEEFFKELVLHHISGQLKVAPEHCSDKVLDIMGKPRFEHYKRFKDKYTRINKSFNKKQYLVPYLISSHPGCTLKDAVLLAEYLRDVSYIPEQVQDFYPTPGTMSTCMYHTGINPLTGENVFVPKTPQEKAMQRALLQYTHIKNYDLVCKALKEEKREDLIGFGKKCLIKPRTNKKKIRYKL